MTWLIDFPGYSMSKAPPVRTQIWTTQVLQSHYPERLGLAVCYYAPRLFSLAYRVRPAHVDVALLVYHTHARTHASAYARTHARTHAHAHAHAHTRTHTPETGPALLAGQAAAQQVLWCVLDLQAAASAPVQAPKPFIDPATV